MLLWLHVWPLTNLPSDHVKGSACVNMHFNITMTVSVFITLLWLGVKIDFYSTRYRLGILLKHATAGIWNYMHCILHIHRQSRAGGGEATYLPERSVTWTKVSLKEAKMWQTPKTFSPSATCGPRLITCSSFFSLPLRGAMTAANTTHKPPQRPHSQPMQR